MFGRRSGNTAVAPVSDPAAEAATDNALEPEQLWQPPAAQTRKSVEQLLLERGQITAEQLTQAQAVTGQTPGKSIAQILLTMSAASEAQILSALAETLDLPFESPQASDVDPAAFSLLQPDYIRRRHVLPIRLV